MFSKLSYPFLFLVAFFITSCSNENNEKESSQSSKEEISELCAIIVEPTDSILEAVKKKQGANFDYAVYADVLFYVSTTYDYFSEINVKAINTKGKSNFVGRLENGKKVTLQHDWDKSLIAVYAFHPKKGFKELEIVDIQGSFDNFVGK
jgi:hypothetical protein